VGIVAKTTKVFISTSRYHNKQFDLVRMHEVTVDQYAAEKCLMGVDGVLLFGATDALGFRCYLVCTGAVKEPKKANAVFVSRCSNDVHLVENATDGTHALVRTSTSTFLTSFARPDQPIYSRYTHASTSQMFVSKAYLIVTDRDRLLVLDALNELPAPAPTTTDPAQLSLSRMRSVWCTFSEMCVWMQKSNTSVPLMQSGTIDTFCYSVDGDGECLSLATNTHLISLSVSARVTDMICVADGVLLFRTREHESMLYEQLPTAQKPNELGLCLYVGAKDIDCSRLCPIFDPMCQLQCRR
jgi:hypothetical protein